MKKKIIISLIIVAIIILSIIIVLNTYNNKVLFKMTGESWSNGYHCWGYTIKSNGVIKEYDNQDRKDKLKSAKIAKEELNKLKELGNKVEDRSYEESKKWMESRDMGSRQYEIYSPMLLKWVVLLSEDDTKIGRNSTNTSAEILKLTEKLYNKYLKTN